MGDRKKKCNQRGPLTRLPGTSYHRGEKVKNSTSTQVSYQQCGMSHVSVTQVSPMLTGVSRAVVIKSKSRPPYSGEGSKHTLITSGLSKDKQGFFAGACMCPCERMHMSVMVADQC